MKKQVLAIAVTTLLAAPFAAQSATTLFGHAHASIDALSADGTPGQDESAIALSNNASRVGIKGSHKFSDSLSGVYHMEWGVQQDGEGRSNDPTEGKGTLTARNRIVGLAGGFGTFVVGRHDTPMKVIGRKSDLFWSTQLGQNRTLTNKKDSPAGWDLRADNVIGYISPNFGPLHIFAVYVTDHGLAGALTSTVSENNDGDAVSVAAILGGGKSSYLLAVAFEEHNAGALSESAIRAVGTYKLGALKFTGFYQSTDDVGFVAGAGRDVIGVGAAFTAGSNTFKGQFYTADELDGGAGADGADLISVGLDHALSKSTAIYANYAVLDNDSNGTYELGGSGHGETATPIAGGEASGFSAGIRIKF